MASDFPLSVKSFFTGRRVGGRAYLVSPFVDFMLAGGLAIIVFTALFFVFPPGRTDMAAATLSIAVVTSWTVFLVNDPHFMVSYQLLYRNFAAKLHRFRDNRELWLRYLVAGIIAPALMILYFAYALWTQNSGLFTFAVSAMLILVGWHYVKQAFGVFMMLSVLKKNFYSARQRFVLLANSYIAWFCYAVLSLSQPPSQSISGGTLWGVGVANTAYLEMPQQGNAVLMCLFMLSGLLSVMVIIWEKKRPSYSALVGYLSMYYLLFAASFHPLWIMLYPLFHSLQYLLFVYAYKRGEAQAQLAGVVDKVGRAKILRRVLWFVVTALVTGVLFFSWIPGGIESIANPDHDFFFPLTAAFIIFINVHHYFIDNVIWRKEHKEIGQYLFHDPRVTTAQ